MKTAFKLLLVLFLFLNMKSKAQVADTLNKYPETVLIKIVESNSFGLINNIDSKMIVVDHQNARR